MNGGKSLIMEKGIIIKNISGSTRINLSCNHSKGILYFVNTESNWVCKDEGMYSHSLIGFFNDLFKADEQRANSLMKKWGIYFRNDDSKDI